MKSIARILPVLIMAALTGAGCAERAEVIVEETELLPYESIGVGANARLSDTTEVLLYTPEAWDAYREKLQSVGPFRPVDFTQEMVVLVAVPVPSGGYSVEIGSVEKKADGIEVDYILYEPRNDCITVEGVAVPYQAVKARRAEGAVRFVRHTEPFPCTLK